MSGETNFGEADQLTRKHWANRTLHEAMQATTWSKHVAEDGAMDDVVVVENDLEDNHGNSVRLTLLEQLPDVAYRGGQDLSDKGCKLSYKYEDVEVDCTDLCPVVWETKKTAQLRPNDLRLEAQQKLRESKSRLMNHSFYSILAGDTLANGDAFRDGNNDICAPSKRRHCFAGDHACEEEVDQDASALMTLQDINELRVLAENHGACADGTFRPIMVEGEEYYKLFLHPFVWEAIKKDPCYKEVQLAAMAGGEIRNNALFTGAKMVWDGVAIYTDPRLPKGITKDGCKYLDNTYRSVLAGAGALSLAYAGVDGAKGEWAEEVTNFGKRRALLLSCYWGMKKNRFAPEDACARGKFNERECDDYATLVFSSQGCPPKGGKTPPAEEVKATTKKAA